MITFSLDHQAVTLANLNTRAELHGERTRGEADAVAAAIRPRYAAETVPVRVEYVAPRRPPKEAH